MISVWDEGLFTPVAKTVGLARNDHIHPEVVAARIVGGTGGLVTPRIDGLTSSVGEQPWGRNIDAGSQDDSRNTKNDHFQILRWPQPGQAIFRGLQFIITA